MPKKRYPPWFAAIKKVADEARKNGMSYGQYVAYRWDMAGRPKIRIEPEDEETPEVCIANEGRYVAAQSVIQDTRERLNLSKRTFAKMVGVSPETIRFWEMGIYKANWCKLVAAVPELAAYAQEEGEN